MRQVSGTAALQFLFAGAAPPDYATALAAVCFLGGALGNLSLAAAVAKPRRSWLEPPPPAPPRAPADGAALRPRTHARPRQPARTDHSPSWNLSH